MEVEKYIAFAVICAVLLTILRHARPEQGMILSVLTSVLLLSRLMVEILPILDSLKELIHRFQLEEENLQLLLKCLGLCFLSQTAADVCRDAGETSLAGKVEMAGKIAILLLCLPLYQELLSIAAKLIL